jgi:beta-glucosidase
MGTKSTTASANAGLDLEMPGPPVFYGANLAAAVENGEVAPAAIDAMVRRLLTAAVRTDAFADPQLHDEKSIDLAEHREVAREAAIEATVLLKNDDHALPLDPGRLRSIAVIGPNADRAQIAGGGSASVRAHYRITPLDALRERLGDGVEVRYEQGCVTDKILPTMTGRELSTIRGEPGLHLEYFANPDLEGDAVRTELRNDSKLIWFGKVLPDTREFSVRARAAYTASRTGVHRLGMITTGRARLLVDGQLLVDAWSELPARGDAYFGFGSVPVVGEVELREGEPVELVLEYSSRDAVFLYAARLGCQPPLPDDARDRAAQAAAACDAAVVVVGTNDDWESEGHDRESMDLPGAQDELIEKVAAANPRTIVVVNAGSPVSMPWVDRVPAVLDVWFGGQEMANGLAAVLCGDAVPSGKLPTTFPRRLEDTPAFDNYPGKNGKVVYEEDIFVGYRHYDLRRIEPRFPFGHGLSYTTFGYSAPRLSAAQIRPGEELEVEVEVTNEGRRAGSEVVQLYVRHVEPRLERPPRELKAFAKLRLDPGETATAVLRLNERSFAFYDPAKPGWVAEPGKYELHVGSSSRDIRHVAELCLTA